MKGASVNPYSIGALVLSCTLLAFMGYKTVHSSFTHDESFTTLHFFPQGEQDILQYRHPFTSVITNNHIFNTLMMKLSESIFGLSEWALRLPNLLALVMYLFFGYRLCRYMPGKWRQLAAFILLLANPYLLDFFGVARGYGLSIGTMIGSLYFLLTYGRSLRGRHLLGFHLLGILSVMSNFALLNFYVAALGCLYLLPVWRRELPVASFVKKWRFHLSNLSAVAVLSALLYTPFQVILEHNTISFGGKDGFFTNTVRSLVSRSLYEFPVSGGWVDSLGYLACLLVVLPFGLVIWKGIRREQSFFTDHAPLFVANTICWLIPLMTVVQHHLFGQDYLEERFAIFLYPLFVLNVLFFLRWLHSRLRFRRLADGLLLGCGGLLLLHTVVSLNTEYYLNWKYDKDTKAIMQLLQEYRPEDGSSRSIGVFHQLEPTMNLYRRWWEMYWIEEFNREPPAPEDDLIFTLESELAATGITVPSDTLFRSPETGMVLLRLRP